MNEQRITIRVNQHEYNDLKRIADAMGYSISEVIRACIHDGVRKYRPIEIDPEYVTRLLQQGGQLLTTLNRVQRDLNMMGNNINQLAHQANVNGVVARDKLREALALMQEITTIRTEVNKEWQLYMLRTQDMERKQ